MRSSSETHSPSREWLASWWQDVRFGVRGLRSRPGFAATVIITLALGIGANAAIFSVVDAVLLRPLPFARPDRLVHLWETFESKVDTRSEASYPDYLDWRARNKVFSDLAGYQADGFLLGGAQPTTVVGGLVTANFFDVLGVPPIAGRTFVTGEDAPDAPHVLVLSYGFWLRQFGGDRGIVGRSITIDGEPATVIGIMPERFTFARMGNADLWAPITRSQQTREYRGNHWLNIVARLKDDASIATASRDMSAIMGALAREYPSTNTGRDGLVVPLRDEFVGSVRPIFELVYGAVIVVLLVACVNVANLLLIRGTDRQREIAVRVALGAGTGRLLRQFLTESVLLAVCGGLLGLGVAKLALRSLLALIPDQQIRGLPALTIAGLDGRVLGYALLVSLASGVGFGMLPALRLARPRIHDSLKSGGRAFAGGAGRLRDALVVGEIALTVVLMCGALLFGRSLMRLLDVDPGFRPEHVVTTTVVLPAATYSSAQAQADVFARFTERVRSVPGVQAVGLTSRLPLDFGGSVGFTVVGQPPPDAGSVPSASFRQVSTDYFNALGISIVRGRVFGAGDDAHAPSVAVVNRALARAYFGDRDPVGQSLAAFRDTLRIVGVVGDVPIGNLGDRVPPTLYVPFAKFPEGAMEVAVRTNATLEQTSRDLRAAASALDPSVALARATTMENLIIQSASVFVRRLLLFLVGAFALTALVLAVVGVHGVVSYSVAQRSREMGIRMALGAQPGSIVGLVLRHGGFMTAAGIAVGVVAALFLSAFAEKLLFGVQRTDPTTYISVAVTLAAVAIAATILPARRATDVDPAIALRAE